MMRCLCWGLLVGMCGAVLAEEFDAKVIVVMDGDTVMVLRDGKKIKVRLANIDAPESDQEYGKESRQALAGLVLKKQVRVKSHAVDSYGRLIAELNVDGQNVSETQLSNGMAWENSRHHRSSRTHTLSQQAQQSRRGLWSKSSQPVSPEQWRKTHLAKTPSAKSASSTYVDVACGKKHLCSQMISCEEAKLYLLQCGVQTLDGNGDGVPCESLCTAQSVQPHLPKQ